MRPVCLMICTASTNWARSHLFKVNVTMPAVIRLAPFPLVNRLLRTSTGPFSRFRIPRPGSAAVDFDPAPGNGD